MNKTVNVWTLLLVVLNMIGLLAASAMAFNYYDLAKRNDIRAKSLNDKLWEVNKSLGEVRSQLAEAQTESRKQQSESQRRLQVIFSQQENVKILKTCLGGVAADDVYFRRGVDYFVRWSDSQDNDDLQNARVNFEKGKEIMDSVDGDCQKAFALFQ